MVRNLQKKNFGCGDRRIRTPGINSAVRENTLHNAAATESGPAAIEAPALDRQTLAPEARKASELAARIADGDEAAESEMVRMYEPGMRRILRTRTDTPSDIDDLVNQVWLLALPKLRRGELRELRALPAYLNTFTRRVAGNYLRHSSRKNGSADPEFFERQASPSEGPYSRVKWTQGIEIAAKLLNTLSVDRDRQILQRFLVNGEDKERVCRDLGLDAVQFNKVLHRARKRFRRLAGTNLADLLDARKT